MEKKRVRSSQRQWNFGPLGVIGRLLSEWPANPTAVKPLMDLDI
jgi:hypothetical protein